MNNNAVSDFVVPDVDVCEVTTTELLLSMVLVHRKTQTELFHFDAHLPTSHL